MHPESELLSGRHWQEGLPIDLEDQATNSLLTQCALAAKHHLPYFKQQFNMFNCNKERAALTHKICCLQILSCC